MKTRILMILALLMCANMLFAQDDVKQVAVYVVENNDIDPNINKVVGAELVSAIKNQKGYKAVERTTQFLSELRKEQTYQQSGNVDDSQISKLGVQLGVDYVCVAEVTNLWGYYISARLVDVETGLVVETAKGSGNFEGDLSKLVSISEQLATDLFGGSTGGGTRTTGGNNGGDKSTSVPSSGKRNGEIYNPDGIEMVYVEGSGSGIMATKGFYIGKYEVTQAQWQAVMGNNPSNFKGVNNPVENVSWNDAQEFIKKLNAMTGRNYSLPTEAQWEYAASGGKDYRGYEYSGSNNIDDVAWYDGNSGSKTHPVGTKSPNALGIYDMSGNVWEWCQDLYDNSSSSRVLRGGSWDCYARRCRVANRFNYSPGYRYYADGFRVALVP